MSNHSLTLIRLCPEKRQKNLVHKGLLPVSQYVTEHDFLDTHIQISTSKDYSYY